jgi:hypothetical protein
MTLAGWAGTRLKARAGVQKSSTALNANLKISQGVGRLI